MRFPIHPVRSLLPAVLLLSVLIPIFGCGNPKSDIGGKNQISPAILAENADKNPSNQNFDFDFQLAQEEIAPVKLGSTRNVHRYGNLILSGQFQPEDISVIKEVGIDRIVSLRTAGELGWDEKSAIEEAGLEYVEHPFLAPETLTDEVFQQVCVVLRESDGRTLVHCGGADRVGAIWLVHRVLDQGLSIEEAEQEAEQVGLRTAAYKEKALAYIRDNLREKPAGEDGSTSSLDETQPQQDDSRQDTDAQQNSANLTPPAQDSKEVSVVPGINDGFLDPDLTPDQWIERFEIESREVYGSRMEILKACNIKPGMRIADIGAGTGVFTRLFANETGPSGWVFAIDISPRLVQHVNQQSAEHNQRNVTAILCLEDSICLPPNSIDLAYICDTYHHFEYPQSTLASIYSALKPGGRMVIIDFIRIEGKSRPWILGHVRAGQEVFTAEVEQAGFELTQQVQIPGFEENYFLIFTKPETSED